MKKALALLLVLLLTISLILSFAACDKVDIEHIRTFSLDDNGEFKILTVADMHFMNDGSQLDADMFERLDKLIKHTQPDLIVLLGDILYKVSNAASAMQIIADTLDSYEIPWAPVYGNHDAEGPSGFASSKDVVIANKKAMNAVFAASEYCIFEPGPYDIEGEGNYIVNILDSSNKIIQTLFFMDSNDYIRKADTDKFDEIPADAILPLKNYGTIYPDQIDWYENAVKTISKKAHKGKAVVPSLAFFHIPLPEYLTAWNLYQQSSEEVRYIDGSKYDGVAAPSFNLGMFDMMVELGSTKGVFVGHDHGNDYAIEYKGITLSYQGAMRIITYPTVSNNTILSLMGGRLLTVKADGSYTMERILVNSLE